MGVFSEWNFDSKQTLMLCGVGAGIITGTGVLIYLYRSSRKVQHEWKQVGVVSKLIVYPARSSQGVEASEVYVENQGPALREGFGYDR